MVTVAVGVYRKSARSTVQLVWPQYTHVPDRQTERRWQRPHLSLGQKLSRCPATAGGCINYFVCYMCNTVNRICLTADCIRVWLAPIDIDVLADNDRKYLAISCLMLFCSRCRPGPAIRESGGTSPLCPMVSAPMIQTTCNRHFTRKIFMSKLRTV